MVLDVAGKVPVVTFSNDDTLATKGAFVMGVTPAQSVSATFSYARAQGMKRLALVATDGPYGRSSAEAARSIAKAGGLDLTAALLRASGAPGLLAELKSAGGGALPDAVFIADGGTDLVQFATALGSSGIKLMGGLQWAAEDVSQIPALAGAWFAAPPPDLFQPFSDRFAAQFGTAPGVVAALAYDAALIAVGLGNAGELNKTGLLRKAGFTGALGSFHFQPDGRCSRDLAILTIANQTIVALGEIGGT
jgi:ABC-type branched-subunit amino acid transport system substrate-binding protein